MVSFTDPPEIVVTEVDDIGAVITFELDASPKIFKY